MLSKVSPRGYCARTNLPPTKQTFSAVEDGQEKVSITSVRRSLFLFKKCVGFLLSFSIYGKSFVTNQTLHEQKTLLSSFLLFQLRMRSRDAIHFFSAVARTWM
jgi:adenine-specific DNA methylase